jgi:hypothetical protein
MLRLAEIALFLVPFALYVVWLIAGRSAPRWAVWAAVAAIVALAAGTVWFGLDRAAPPGSIYEPAHIEDGTIVPGRAASPGR